MAWEGEVELANALAELVRKPEISASKVTKVASLGLKFKKVYIFLLISNSKPPTDIRA